MSRSFERRKVAGQRVVDVWCVVSSSERWGSVRDRRVITVRLDQARAGGILRRIGNPSVMKLATTYGMPVPVLRELALKLMANLTDTADPDPMDRLINTLSRVTPAA